MLDDLIAVIIAMGKYKRLGSRFIPHILLYLEQSNGKSNKIGIKLH
jgi:hypothetical protein